MARDDFVGTDAMIPDDKYYHYEQKSDRPDGELGSLVSIS